MKVYMYILECADGSYYTGSTKDMESRRRRQPYKKKRLPVKLVYFEEYQRINEAFFRVKQAPSWNRKKKDALINGKPELLPKLTMAYRDIKKAASGISAAFIKIRIRSRSLRL